MANRADQDRKEAKRQAVVTRLREAMPALDTLSGMWEEKTLDALLLAFGIGHVVLDEDAGE
jgi:hypothetical protein